LIKYLFFKIFIDINVSGQRSKTQKIILIFFILDIKIAGIITVGGEVPKTKIESNFLLNILITPKVDKENK